MALVNKYCKGQEERRSRRRAGLRSSQEKAMSEVCQYCGCQPSQARADAKTLGLQEEFERGIYACCQVVAWADEQWLVWAEAAEEDGSPVEQVTKPLEYADPEREERRPGQRQILAE